MTRESHRCGGCGHRWSGDAPGTLCGECWRQSTALRDKARELRAELESAADRESARIVDQHAHRDLGQRYAALVGAARALLAKLDTIHRAPGYKAVWETAQLHIGPYLGPSCEKEVESLRAVLPATTSAAEYRCDDAYGCDWHGSELVPDPDGVLRCPACSSVAIIEPTPLPAAQAALVALVREWQEARKPATLSAPGEFLAETFQAAVRRMSAADEALAGYRLDEAQADAPAGVNRVCFPQDTESK